MKYSSGTFFTVTFSTRATVGPLWHHDWNSSKSSGDPSAWISTLPSSVLRTQPAMFNASACCFAVLRKKTPWTEPVMMIRMAGMRYFFRTCVKSNSALRQAQGLSEFEVEHYFFLTCVKSNSTGVSRSKMSTMTVSLPLFTSTESTEPS